ncbi:uncharacterized protein C8A04DRAFT_31518 [Dichotomopilus funicola]|uniref:Uncharacterized protein n=1 Tax=Dichotomopilus funicola TaxID=1934379 RepID=A0AAN6UZX6_9PEZI|nr:hypothetical protein C8A04DRAFT_31518 [Dichotomopilus funicola]
MAGNIMTFINPPPGNHQHDFGDSPMYQVGSVVDIAWTPANSPGVQTSLTLWQLNETTGVYIGDQEYISRKAVDITTFKWIVATSKALSVSRMFYLSIFREGQLDSDSESHTFFIVESDKHSPPPPTSTSKSSFGNSVSPSSSGSSSSSASPSSSIATSSSASSLSAASPSSSASSSSSALITEQSGSPPAAASPSTGTNPHTTTPPTTRQTNTSSGPASPHTATDTIEPSTNPSDTPVSNNGLDTGAIIGIILGITCVVVLGAIFGFLLFKRRKMRARARMGKKYNGMVEDQSAGPFEKWAGTPRFMGNGMIYQISPSELPVPPTELPTGLEKPQVYELP